MLIKIHTISRIWKLRPQGILHVGAHKAEELKDYTEENWGHVYWIEANPELAQKLERTLSPKTNTVLTCAAWDIDKKMLNFYENSESQASSLLPLKRHALYYPKIHTKLVYEVETRRIDTLFDSPLPFTFANLDVQGAELQVLRGFGGLISSLDGLYLEVNKEELYEGCANVKELDLYLQGFKFERVATRWIIGKGWGDALYLNCERNKHHHYSRFMNTIDSFPFYSRQIFSIFLVKARLMPLAKRIREKLRQH